MTQKALSCFENLDEAWYTKTVKQKNGIEREISLPIAYSPQNGRYYLADLKRHIMVGDYESFIYHNQLNIWSAQTNENWPEEYLLTYETYQNVYDYYKERGLDSVDGFGTPILVLTDACYSDGSVIDNAFYQGIRNGWAIFGANKVNCFGECMDVITHEFTHGITEYCLGGDIYQNESGAINEALSDIMGCICELTEKEHPDTDWLIAEDSGRAVRSLQAPYLYQLPVEVNGTYSMPSDITPTYENDKGGVHVNSTIIGHIGWKLYDRGISVDDQFLLWRTTINLLTPRSGFAELKAANRMAARMLSFSEEKLRILDEAWTESGI